MMARGRNFKDRMAAREMEPEALWLLSFSCLSTSSFVTDGSAGEVRCLWCLCVLVKLDMGACVLVKTSLSFIQSENAFAQLAILAFPHYFKGPQSNAQA